MNPSSNFLLDMQLKESFTILFGLVFELRQGVEDLQFHLHTMDGKVTGLLQIFPSLQDAFLPNPVGVALAAEPHAETSKENT